MKTEAATDQAAVETDGGEANWLKSVVAPQIIEI